MGNILDYLGWRLDVPLRVSPFNPVDNLILSAFSYLALDGFEGQTISEIAPTVCAREQHPSYREMMRMRQTVPNDDLSALDRMGEELERSIAELEERAFCSYSTL